MLKTKPLLIEPETAQFPMTYINSVSKLTLRMSNNDSTLFRYEWRRYGSESEERQAIAMCDSSDPTQRDHMFKILLFESDVFSIDPISSEIWPGGRGQFIIDFAPKLPVKYSVTAFLYNKDTHERIPFEIRGEGLPATADLSIDQINIGHVYLGKVMHYEIALNNLGQLPFSYSLIERKLPFLVFRFSPDRGHLTVGESKKIIITFEATRVGQFNESFEFQIEGVEGRERPKITLYGRVIGPSLKLSRDLLDFGTVSVGFLYRQEFDLENVTGISCDFSFALEHDSTFEAREFSIIPNEGIIEGDSKKRIVVEFIPINVKDYKVNLILESIRFEERLATIPMISTCICPPVSIVTEEINLGRAFIDHQYTLDLVMRNTTKFPAKFEFIEADDESTLDATVTVGKYRGVVPEDCESHLPVFIKPIQLGHLDMVRYIRIIGSSEPPMAFRIKGLCVGPNVKLSMDEVNFGDIGVLHDVRMTLDILNDSLIPAPYHADMDCETGVFRIEEADGVIEPGETLQLPVIAFLDDTIQFTGKITLTFRYLAPIVVNVSGKGTGTAIVSSIDMRKIDFSYIFTSEPVVKTFVLENKGRRRQELKWTQAKPKVEGEGESSFTYSLSPESRVLDPKEKVTYTLTVFAQNPCTFDIVPQCTATIGKARLDLFQPKIRGILIDPALVFEKKSISFRYVHDIEKEEEISGAIRGTSVIMPSQDLLLPITISNSVTNSSKLPVKAIASCPKPFEISRTEFDLGEGEKIDFEVTFHTNFKRDFTSQVIVDKIMFSFVGIPQTYALPLRGALIFPNLTLSAEQLDFGTMLKHTEQTKVVHVVNCSEVGVDFEWELLPAIKGQEISKAFDVYPIRGRIEPSDEIDIHVTFFASGANDEIVDGVFRGLAVCHVAGGPDYTIELTGSSADIAYKLTNQILDFGEKFYSDILTGTVSLTNQSDVPLVYKVKIPRACPFLQMRVNPMSGAIDPNETQLFDVQVLPGFPKNYNETFFIQIGQFDEAEIGVRVNCGFPLVHVTMNRTADDPVLARAPANASEEKIGEIEKSVFVTRLSDILKSPKFVTSLLKPIDIKSIANNGRFSGFIAGKFGVDMGHITLGEFHMMKHKVKSLSNCPVSAELLVVCLADSGFTVEPTSIEQLSKDEEIELTFSFDAAKRTSERTGNEVYEIPMVFSQDFGYMIELRACISMPSLEFSKSHFEFEQTLVGQTRIQSFQMQNTTAIPIEFTVGNAEQCGAIKTGLDKNLASIFSISPKSGMLPPSAFQNFEITFAPNAERIYAMQFPITVVHNTEKSYITARGTGVYMKVGFNPPEVTFPAMKPYDEPLFTEVELVNPCSYPIEVYSPQFDFQILCKQLQLKWESMFADEATLTQTQPLEATPVEPEPVPQSLVSRFSLCVIVNGPPKSGKTTVSRMLAEYLRVPVISFNDIWNDDTEDYVGSFREYISGLDYSRGFIIDGLEFFPEPAETQTWLTQSLKQKSVNDEVNKNPYANIACGHQTAAERALSYILASLDGQYVFQVALSAKDEVIQKHDEQAQDDAKKERELQEQRELERILNMSEEEYSKLTDEEKEEVDHKRNEHRMKVLDEQGIETEICETGTPLKQGAQEPATRSMRRAPRKSVRNRLQLIVNDPNQMGLVKFMLSLGRMTEMMKKGANFQAIDPNILTGVSDEQITGASRNLNTILVDAGLPKESVFEAIQAYLPRPDDIKKQVTKLIPKAKLDLPQFNFTEFMEPPQHFRIYNTEPAGELPEFDPSLLQTSPTHHGRNPGASPAARKKMYAQKIEELTEDIDLCDYTKRWILEPGAREKITVQFSSTHVGSFEESLGFQIKDCRDDVFDLKLKGLAVYPDIERSPEVIFGKTTQRLTANTKYAYVTTLNEFHFGPVLVTKEKAGKNATGVYKQQMKLVNNSVFPAEIQISLADTPGKSPWSLDQASLFLAPGDLGLVNICFHPTSSDTFRTTVRVFIKDNPEPYSFGCVAIGCTPTMELSQQQLDFEKLLVHQTRTMELEVRNTSKIPISWRIKAANQLGLFEFDLTEGTLAPRASYTLRVHYMSDKQQALKKAVQFEVLDKNKVKVYQVRQVVLIAESFDVNFDIIYPKGMDLLNFGTFKVFEGKQLTCTLRNRGKYPALFKFTHIRPNLRKVLTVQPNEGTIPPGDKGINVVMTFNAKRTYDMVSTRVLGITVLDSISQSEILNMTISATAKAVFTEYSLEPAQCLDFGAVPVNTTATKNLVIKNCGVFPFEFTIAPKVEEPVVPPKTARSKSPGKKPRQSQAPRSARTVQKKRKNAKELQIGQFVLSQCSGVVAPDSTAVISTEFFNAVPEASAAAVVVKITDVAPADPAYEGFEFQMKATTHTPALDLTDMEPIFPNQQLCLRYDVEKMEMSAFLEDENTFHFAPTIINQTRRIEVALINAVPVVSTIDLALKYGTGGGSPKKIPKTAAEDQPSGPFVIEEASVDVDPSGKRFVGLRFTPLSIGKVSALFTATVRGTQPKDTVKVLRFNVEGTGTLPTISALGADGQPLNGTSVSFGRTLINYRKERFVTIRNDGIIASKLAITADPSQDFTFENHDFVREITVEPQRSFNLVVSFCPKASKKSTFRIHVDVLENPESSLDVNFIGEGFLDDVIFEGIPGDENELVFHDIIVGRQQQVKFLMKNVCQNDIRFQWAQHNEFKFMPAQGHLRKGSTKTVIATFFSEKPLKLNNVKSLCQWSKIRLVDPEAQEWDSSMKNVKFVPRNTLETPDEYAPAPPDMKPPRNSGRRFPAKGKKPPSRTISSSRRSRRKNLQTPPLPSLPPPTSHPLNNELVRVVEPVPEPEYQVIPGKTKDLMLKVSGVCDYIKYSLETDEIAFSPTMMFETRTVRVKLTNTSQIKFDYLWMAKNVVSLQSGSDKFQLSPFSVVPRSGVIEGGATATFDVKFSPEDVDDYTADLVCEIPFLSQMPPPTISVSGISRRPLCHFNVKLSDYIVAGRRHPDYTYPLPDNIRVIELFSNGIHKRAIKKFEIINATAYPYEVFWKEDEEHKTPAIVCEYPRVLISSGKRSIAMFSYLPTSVRTVESVWTFTIPEHDIKITFLVVGRIMPH